MNLLYRSAERYLELILHWAFSSTVQLVEWSEIPRCPPFSWPSDYFGLLLFIISKNYGVVSDLSKNEPNSYDE